MIENIDERISSKHDSTPLTSLTHKNKIATRTPNKKIDSNFRDYLNS